MAAEPARSPRNATLLDHVRAAARGMEVSGIVEVMKYGFGRDGLIPLWAGEGDLPTPDFICDAATRSLGAGETFYTWQRGIPELRMALARYHATHYGIAPDPERFCITASGMHAIVLAFALTLDPGDEVIIPSPSWPNAGAAADAAAAMPMFVPMTLGASGFSLDLDRLADAIGRRTRAIFLNSPGNPTGWVASRADLAAVLALARKHGLWIVADDVYGRFHWGEGARAPSFHDVMEPGDRVLFVNTFSKNWAMTGWRIGWIEADPSLGQVIENLIQASTSGVAVFMQRAAVVALERGEGFVAHQVERARRGREIVATLAGTGRIRLVPPAGAFYQLLSIDGELDSRALAFRLIDEA
ncbi:MAG: pyridoxal phosphate-dependent aminotransferase, partial [Xanthobacteraceae bacterium]